MHNILFIAFQNENYIKKGSAFWKGEHFQKIIDSFDLQFINTDNTKRAIGYFIGNNNADKKCVDLHLKTIKIKADSLYLEYDFLEYINYESAAVKNSLYSVFSSFSSEKFLPFCYCLPEEQFFEVIEDESLLVSIRKLTAKNQWLAIYQKYFPLEKIKSIPQFWNNPKVLSALSFASAKLSEVYINLKYSFADDLKRKEFLKQQKIYREETIELRKQCIELAPENPGYYSNLGYSYYQFCRELVLAGGRRDSILKNDAENAVKYLNLALDLDPNRIPDLYRKGQILLKVLPNQLLFKNTATDSNNDKALKFLNDSISCFQKVEEVYELLPEIDEKSLQRYHKEYIKSLYNCADAYQNLQSVNWSYTNIIFQDHIPVLNINIQKINIALNKLEKCINLDNPAYKKFNIKPEPFTFAKYNGEVEGVYKLYFYGKLNFIKYCLLTEFGKIENFSAEENYVIAEKFFKEAMFFPFSKQLQKMNKAFIAEKLARLYILKNRFSDAMKVLEKYIEKNCDYYIRYTYSLAAIKSGEFEKAKIQIEKALTFPKSNKDIISGLVLLSVAFIRQRNYSEAEIQFNKAVSEASKSTIVNIDSALINQAIIHYKNKNISLATDILKNTIKISQNRISLLNRFHKYLQESKNL